MQKKVLDIMEMTANNHKQASKQASKQATEQLCDQDRHSETFSNTGGRRGYGARFFFALFPCGLLCFIYLFFGPLSLIHNNGTDLHISIWQATPWYLFAFVLGAALLAAVVALFRGRLFDGWVRVILWISIASYIQGNFLNPDFGLLDGRTIEWPGYSTATLINLAAWGLMLLIISIAELKLSKHWKKIVCGASLLLALIQSAALVSFYIDEAGSETPETRYYLSAAEAAEVSSQENVIVFILDAASNNALDRTLLAYPDALAPFHDFTHYRNCAPIYYGTYPELILLLTGNERYDVGKSYIDFERESWQSEKANAFYGLLNDAGYRANCFARTEKVSRSYSNVEGKLGNATPYNMQWRIQPIQMYKQMAQFTFFVYFPTGLKASFFTVPGDFSAITASNLSRSASWDPAAPAFTDQLFAGGLSAVDSNIYSLYHLQGAHAPYTMNEAGVIGTGTTSMERQLNGSLFLIAAYMQQLKDMGVYDASTIIMTADHGDYQFTGSQRSNSTVLFVKLRGEEHAQMQVSDAPVTHMELMPTIAEEIAPDHSYDFGRTLADIGENEVRERTLYRWMKLDKNSAGAYDSFYVFHYDGNINDLNDLSAPDEVLLLYDSHY